MLSTHIKISVQHVTCYIDCCSLLSQVYNLGTGIGYSVLDMVKAFEAASGRKVDIAVLSYMFT